MRIMISKWILDRLNQRNPTLAEYVDNYGSLNEQTLVTGKNVDDGIEDGVPFDWGEFVSDNCNETDMCAKTDCTESLKMNFEDDELLNESLKQNCEPTQ